MSSLLDRGYREDNLSAAVRLASEVYATGESAGSACGATALAAAVDRAATVKIEVPSSWKNELRGQLQAVQSLRGGWDGASGRPIDPRSLLDALHFLTEAARHTLVLPAIVPLSSGGVQLEWHGNAIDIEVAFDGRASEVLISDPKSEHYWEGTLRQVSPRLAWALSLTD